MTHKKYDLPCDDLYCPIIVGNQIESLDCDHYERDSGGDNISERNRSFCELTALYWIWKNYDIDDYIGLVHYRRYLGRPALERSMVKQLLEKADVILPCERRYYIETNYSQYAHAHNAADLDRTREIIASRYPDYLPYYDRRMSMTHGHRFNMFIMKKELFSEYSDWLFDILFELEKSIDISGYDSYNQRVFGFISERLLDVWLDRNEATYTEVPVLYTEKEKWLKKAVSFLRRKLLAKRR